MNSNVKKKEHRRNTSKDRQRDMCKHPLSTGDATQQAKAWLQFKLAWGIKNF